MTAIYGLADPDGFLRYIGSTNATPQSRLRNHVSNSHLRQHPTARWLFELKRNGCAPTLEVLEEVSPEQAADAERFWIASLRVAGAQLLNIHPGGPGGGKHSPTARQQMSMARLGMQFTEKHRKNIGNSSRGRVHTQATKDKIRAGNLGKKKHRASKSPLQG